MFVVLSGCKRYGMVYPSCSLKDMQVCYDLFLGPMPDRTGLSLTENIITIRLYRIGHKRYTH